MSRFGIVGPSYASQSPNLNCEICMNLYVEQDESGAGNAPLAMYSTPGTKVFVDLTPAAIGGLAAFDKAGASIGTSAAIATPTLVPVSANAWAFMALGIPTSAFTPAAGWTTIDVNLTYSEVFLSAANITGNGTLNLSDNWISALLLFKLIGNVAPTLIQKGGQSGAFFPPYNPAFGANTKPGSTIIFTNYVAALNSGDLAPTLTDSQGNVYTHTSHQLGAVGELDVWVAQNIVGGPLVFTLNSAKTGTSRTSNFYEFAAGTPAPFSFVRGSLAVIGRAFFVAGTNFYEVLANGTKILWGQVANDGLPVTMAASPQQLLLASAGTAYVFDLMANTLTAIAGATFAGPVAQAAICDDFFILTIQNSKQFVVSAPLQALDWVTNGAAIVSVFPDNIVSMIVFQRQIWFFSDTQSVVYYDSGNIFPFDVNPNAFIEAGSAAENSPAIFNNSIAWLGADARGSGKVWLASGYTPTRISNHAIEFAIQSYTRIDDAVGFSYQDQGHEFYCLYFPTPSVMWVYDAMTGMWHQRGFWVESVGQFRAAHYQNHIFAFRKHLVGDWQSGNVYQMSIPVALAGGLWDFCTDAGNPIRRVRRAPHVSKEQKKQFHIELQIYVETGLGPTPPLGTSATLSDTFIRANENPLNPAIWKLATNPPLGNWAHLQIVSNAAQSAMDGSAGITEGVETYLGTIFPPDQTGEMKILALTNNASAGITLRGDVSTWFSYEMLVSDLGGGLCNVEIDLWNGEQANPIILFNSPSFVFVAGDTFKFEARGSSLFCYRNNVLLGAAVDNTHSTGGFIAVDLLPNISSADARVSNFAASAQAIRDPQLMLSWSDDGGHTFGNEFILNCGQTGQFKNRVRKLQLGSTRDRVYQIAMSDPIPWRIVDGYLQVVEGTGI